MWLCESGHPPETWRREYDPGLAKVLHLPGPCDWFRNKNARLKPDQEESPLKLFFWSYQKRPILLGLIGWWDIRWGYGEPSDLQCSHWLLL